MTKLDDRLIDTRRDYKKLQDIYRDKSLDFNYMIKALVDQQRFGISVDFIGEAIIQAFKEAGYIDAKNMIQVSGLIQEQAKILKDMADVNAHGMPLYDMMTGQQWYDQFEDEFLATKKATMSDTDREAILDAARKAAGLE